jgi:hypothetical protein
MLTEQEKIDALRETRQRNNSYAWLLSDYINNSPCAISPSFLHEIDEDGILPEATLVTAILSGLLNLDPSTNEEDNILIDNYLRQSVTLLRQDIYKENPYYKNICIPETSFQNWKLTKTVYQPYEAFVYKDIIVKNDFREIPQIGFFSTPFSFPAVHENGREWMAIKPSEIETMQPAINQVAGNVAVFGLGLGYFPYMISLKESVSHISIIERDSAVIQLFNTYILPQFEHKEKIEIICTDAFDFMKNVLPKQSYDYAFVDLWHDTADGLPLYKKAKGMERFSPDTKYLYWVEDSLLSAYRWQRFDAILSGSKSYDDICQKLRNESLARELL